MTANRVRKAVFPVAGLGTRLLPATKTMPKEMLTIVDRPLIQYAVDEAREAGIEQMIFVTGRGKSSLIDYFDTAFELEAVMSAAGKSLDALKPSNSRFGEVVSVRQQQPLGLGHAVWSARDIVGDEPFAVLLPDDLMFGTPGALKQMVDAWGAVGGNLLATEEVAAEKTASYGIITPGEMHGALTQVRGLVEKPAPDVAPSRLSFHLKVLKDAGLVQDRKDGRWSYYTIVPGAFDEAHDHVINFLPKQSVTSRTLRVAASRTGASGSKCCA